MKISKLTPTGGDWHVFHLNLGGFTIKKCRWNSASGQILFPRRYSREGRRHKVVWVRGSHVNRLRDLLESGEAALPRDRRPCKLKVRFLGWSRWEEREQRYWMIFSFAVRGFTILGCRWQPSSGSIQLPVTFWLDEVVGYRRRQVVCAYGAHINRLRKALEEHWYKLFGDPEEEAQAEAAEIVNAV